MYHRPSSQIIFLACTRLKKLKNNVQAVGNQIFVKTGFSQHRNANPYNVYTLIITDNGKCTFATHLRNIISQNLMSLENVSVQKILCERIHFQRYTCTSSASFSIHYLNILSTCSTTMDWIYIYTYVYNADIYLITYISKSILKDD